MAPKLTVESVQLRWTEPAIVIDRIARAATPSPGAWTTFRDKRSRWVRFVPWTSRILPPASCVSPPVKRWSAPSPPPWLSASSSRGQAADGCGRVAARGSPPPGDTLL